MTRPTKERLEQVRQWLADYQTLTWPACSEVEWIMLKLSCSRQEAHTLVAAAIDPQSEDA